MDNTTNASLARVLEVIEMAHGLAIDVEEGWHKLIARQFGGGAGRGFCELIQNAIDSYAAAVPLSERRTQIDSGPKRIRITDWGEGLNTDRLKLLVTLGGTDKLDDASKIGRFGIGFFSIFNPMLGTRLVTVTTRCDGHPVELVFRVIEPGDRPALSARILEGDVEYSTRVEVGFDDADSPGACLRHARKHLEYYPCPVTIDGEVFRSVWHEAEVSGAQRFQEGACCGFVRAGGGWQPATLLRRYERIIETPVAHLLTGGHGMKHDLRDHFAVDVPYVPGRRITINCDDLNVTISRDGFYLDNAFYRMRTVLQHALLVTLRDALKSTAEGRDVDLVLANQFVLRDVLGRHFEEIRQGPAPGAEDVEREVCRLLAEARVYRLSGRRNAYSLVDIHGLRSKGTPLWIAPEQTNLRWLGGAFRHDFIVLPPTTRAGGGAPDLAMAIFQKLFDDVVDLDRVKDQPDVLARLVAAGVIAADALAPKARIRGELELTPDERRLCAEIDLLLRRAPIRRAIQLTLGLPVRSVRTTFFEVEAEGINVATGLFDGNGRVVDARPDPTAEPGTYLLGLRRSDPFVDHLVGTKASDRACYSLTYLAHQLTASQEQLVPHSRPFQFVRQTLSTAMRSALLETLVTPDDALGPEPSALLPGPEGRC